MKKVFAIILALLYLGASTGATIQLHYCMGKLADWRLGNSKSESCGNCGMERTEEEASGCCKDEHKFIKTDLAQKTAESILLAAQSMSACLPTHWEIEAGHFCSVTEKNPGSNALLRSCGTAIYKRNCSFRI
jgi:hypothetical protein